MNLCYFEEEAIGRIVAVKVIILIIAGGGEIHEIDELAQRQTWAKSPAEGVEVIWLRGRPGSEFIFEDRTLYVPCENNFSSILQKTVLGIQWVELNRSFDLLIRSNTSTYFNLADFNLSNFKYQLDSVGGTFETSRKSFASFPKGYRYLNGSGLYLGRTAISALTGMNPQEFIGIPDDLAIHSFFESVGFKFYEVPRNNLDLHHIFVPRTQVRVKSWSKPELTISRMGLVHEYFQSLFFSERLVRWWLIELNEISNSRISFKSIRNFLFRQVNHLRRI